MHSSQAAWCHMTGIERVITQHSDLQHQDLHRVFSKVPGMSSSTDSSGRMFLSQRSRGTMLAGQSPKDDYGTVHVDTTPTCTRADAHVSRAYIAVHSSLINLHALAQGTRDQCRAFLKNIVMSSSCLCQVSLSLVSLLSLHLLLVLCHDLQRHRHHWRGPD